MVSALVLALVVSPTAIVYEAFNPRYCPSNAIGYLRVIKDGVVVAGGNAKYHTASRHGGHLIAWFPPDQTQVRLSLNFGDSTVDLNYEGAGSIRMHHGVYCVFPYPMYHYHEVFPHIPKSAEGGVPESHPLPSPTPSA